MLAFSSVRIDSDGKFEFIDGTLVSLPAELKDKKRIRDCLKLINDGWYDDEFGYRTLVMSAPTGERYILPSLYLTDCKKPRKKIPGYNSVFSSMQISLYLRNHIRRNDDIRKKSEEVLLNLVHDLRHLSSSIYHSALGAENELKQKEYRNVAESLKTVIATQTMLKVRTDFLDYSSGSDRFSRISEIPVYSRVDKVIRCFRATAKNREIEIELKGESFRLAHGPDILDIVSYVILDNAIKYSPKGHRIVVSVYDLKDSTKVFVDSVGPSLDDKDGARIFEHGYRGPAARRLVQNGSGIGLHTAKSILDIFEGSITVSAGDAVYVNSEVNYQNITFSFTVPTHGEDAARRERSSRRRRPRKPR